jgi:PAS domain-containing protein
VHRRKDGSVWHMESSATRPGGGGGQVVAFIRDISARKRDEAALREAERKFKALVQQSLVGVYIIRDGDWLYINPQMARMFGYASRQNASPVATSATWSPRKAGSWLPRTCGAG